ncbi:MAG: dihydrofolate reductase family protein [Verrucomicrobia bacterium]|jgi:dihydrofolate reductase|nr:dihydrofolate reductase family protein [Verrucomicrobiota bacterium]
MSRPSQVGILSTLEEPLAWNTRLVRASVADEIRALKQQTGDPLRSIGSVSLVKSMIQLGLVDRLRLMVFPLIFGTAGGSSGATIDFLLSAKRDESSG